MPLVVANTPALLDLAAQLAQGSGRQARGFHVRAVQHELVQLLPTLLAQPWQPARPRAVVQSRQALGIVAQHRIAALVHRPVGLASVSWSG